jgi:hypothetical protein
MSEVHVVRQGECLSSIARRYGFKDWTVLYDHPANAELKGRRPNPNVLLPGDLVAIPEQKYTELTRPTGDWHEFTVQREEPRLKMQLLDVDRKPLPNQDYQLTIDGKDRHGTTDSDGLLDEPINLGSHTAVLKTTVQRGDEPHELEMTLNIGSLDPTNKTSGLQGRLRNLRFYDGDIDGNFGPLTREAVIDFQESVGLDPTGMPNDATLKELEKQHDSVT